MAPDVTVAGLCEAGKRREPDFLLYAACQRLGAKGAMVAK